jgi:hypothetical protein
MQDNGAEERKKNHVWSILTALCSAIPCGITFLFALYRQLALVEVTTIMVMGVELYFLGSSIGLVMDFLTARTVR